MLLKIIFYVTEDFKNSTIKQFKCEKNAPSPGKVHTLPGPCSSPQASSPTHSRSN